MYIQSKFIYSLIMKTILSAAEVLAEFRRRGVLSSADLQRHFDVSQPTVSRLLGSLDDELISLGAARSTRYAIAEPIGKYPAQQPIMRITEQGLPERIGMLSFLSNSTIHIGGDGVDIIYEPRPGQLLPWFLSGLRAQGFLGRILAKDLSGEGVGSDPEKWGASAVLVAALHTHDAPGSLLLGNSATRGETPQIPLAGAGAFLDAFALDIAKTLPTGSSAGGEQPKFLAIDEDGHPVIVKFSPPLKTQYGDRWSDLLCAEELSSRVLRENGFKAASNRIMQSTERTYLLSKRFDREPLGGRLHVVSIGAVHDGFVKGVYQNWGGTCDALAARGKLDTDSAESANHFLQFGRLIGNTDMHSGNLSVFAKGETLNEIMEGNFSLAPIYDMLPMRWKPDANLGLNDYEPFQVDFTFASSRARIAAKEFWSTLSEDDRVSANLRQVAGTMSFKFGSTMIATEPSKPRSNRPK